MFFCVLLHESRKNTNCSFYRECRWLLSRLVNIQAMNMLFIHYNNTLGLPFILTPSSWLLEISLSKDSLGPSQRVTTKGPISSQPFLCTRAQKDPLFLEGQPKPCHCFGRLRNSLVMTLTVHRNKQMAHKAVFKNYGVHGWRNYGQFWILDVRMPSVSN